ncbi:SMI1/KNR4 family protein [Streptomyces sp. NPDC001530]|uniref:SMI1/KNR4 family protein n=1 Tax=Streptomyces sp. NPDC001530 TaxID=3364582 RepID=UPI0036C8F6B2
MDEQELLAAVTSLLRPGGQELVCSQSGHPAGHVCMTASGAINLSTLLKEFSRWYGRPRNLAMGGYVDPTVTERTGLPLLAPFAGELVEMRGWASGSRWIGCGAVRAGDGEQLVVLVAERAAPSPDALPEGTSWVDSLLRVTGWDARDAAQPWAEIEAALGTELPSDYKQLCQAFGVGEFSQVVSVLCSDETRVADLLRMWRVLLEGDDPSDGPFAPYPIHVPGTTGGLIPWGTSRAADMFFWQVTDGAVDAWPVLAKMEDAEDWDRYEMTATEFLYRILTDPRFWPYSVADSVPEPFFEPV